MKTPKDLLLEVMKEIDINVKVDLQDEEFTRIFLDKLNKYFYQMQEDYVSPFHEYWEAKHADVLNIKINLEQAEKLAYIFEDIFSNPAAYPELQLTTSINKDGLSKEEIANVRFFTAIQDFKINIYKKGRDPFQEFKVHPEWFTPEEIIKDPIIILNFLQYLEATGSQGDKRQKWMKNASEFLITQCDGEAYNILSLCDNDVEKVRKFIADDLEIGFSRKKADMFIRDMIDWGVWDNIINVESLNVASDANTIRVALRSGLMEPSIPLLASYFDVHCHQYALIDKKTQEAWRTVWFIWRNMPDNHCPPTPASMDYLIYKSIGKKYCLLNKRKCNQCVLNNVCPQDKRHLKPPKSISIYGQTGWESGKTDSGGGGGIMA